MTYSKTDTSPEEINKQYNDEINRMKSYFTSEYEKKIFTIYDRCRN